MAANLLFSGNICSVAFILILVVTCHSLGVKPPTNNVVPPVAQIINVGAKINK